MKKFILLLIMSLSVVAFAQRGNVNDILFAKSGEIIQGKVVKVTSETISFSYPGETLINEVKVNELEKIVFSSGRTQNFTGNAVKNQVSPPTVQEPEVSKNELPATTIPKDEIYLGPNFIENKLVVIPSSFYKNGTYDKNASSRVTQFATDYLARKNQSLPINVQEMNATIKMLVDAGIGIEQLKNTPVDKLQSLLRAEYLIMVEVNESYEKPQTKSSGFFDEEETVVTESSIRYDIELVIFGGLASEKYATKFSDERSLPAYAQNGAQNEDWKLAMRYVLDRVLTSGNL